MGRWTQYDEDEYRLPHGMKRVGYDADTQKYTFKDQSGGLWEGPEGAEYGEMIKVGGPPIHNAASSSDIEAAAPTRADGYKPLPSGDLHTDLQAGNRSAYRQIMPFVLIIIVCLLLVFRLLPSASEPRPPSCAEHSRSYTIRSGDSCWAISKDFGTSLDQLRSFNPSLDCATLKPGEQICVPLDS